MGPWGAIGKIRPQIEYQFWAGLGHEGQTLADLVHKMESLGNTIMEIDEGNQRLLVAHMKEAGAEQWGCRICLEAGSIVITDSETELINHCNTSHEGWEDDNQEGSNGESEVGDTLEFWDETS